MQRALSSGSLWSFVWLYTLNIAKCRPLALVFALIEVTNATRLRLVPHQEAGVALDHSACLHEESVKTSPMADVRAQRTAWMLTRTLALSMSFVLMTVPEKVSDAVQLGGFQ